MKTKFKVKIGEMTERLILMKRTIKETPQGDVEQVWEETEEVWGKVSPLPVTDKLTQEGWNEEQDINLRYKVTIRFCCYPFQRIKWKKQIYSIITPPQMDEKKDWLTFIIEWKEK